MVNALRRAVETCPDCGSVLNAGCICEFCGTVPTQQDLYCQMTIEHLPGAALFRRSALNPSKSFRSDGND